MSHYTSGTSMLHFEYTMGRAPDPLFSLYNYDFTTCLALQAFGQIKNSENATDANS
jgi:hypothetical protein